MHGFYMKHGNFPNFWPTQAPFPFSSNACLRKLGKDGQNLSIFIFLVFSWAIMSLSAALEIDLRV